MMPQSQSRNEFLKSTMANLAFIDEAFQSKKRVYDVTQLVNSFLMTLLQTWDELEKGWPQLPQGGVVWPHFETSPPNQQARECVERYAMHWRMVIWCARKGNQVKSLLCTFGLARMEKWWTGMRRFQSTWQVSLIALSNWQNKRSPAANG